MNVIYAQLKKDLRCYRIALIVWSACAACEFIAQLDQRFNWGANLHGNLFAELSFIIPITLILWVIHEDSLTDAAAFWRTRPMPRLKLLAAKLLFIIIPLAIALLVCAGDERANLIGMLPAGCVFVSGLIAFASVTSTFWGPLVYFLGIEFGAAFLARFVAALCDGHWPLASSLNYSADSRFWIVFTLGFLIVTAHQYLTLKTRVSVVLLFIGFFVAQLFNQQSWHA